MKSKLPLKRLFYFNFRIIIFLILFNFFTSIVRTEETDIHHVAMQALLGGILLLLNAYINLLLMIIAEKHLKLKEFKQKTILIAVAAYIINILVFLFVVSIYNRILDSKEFTSMSYIILIIISIMVNTLIIVLQRYIILLDAKANADLENSKLREAHSNAANQLLRQQIHPHFLFNALNILKSLYKINPKGGEEYLIRLSNFLRAAVSTNNIKVIAIKEEIKLCVDYLEMQKIRFGSGLEYFISLSDEALNKGFVPSFSIQPLIENAIKHNEITEESPLKIKIEQINDQIRVSNNLQTKVTSETATGSGLLNLTERYRILTHEEISIEEDDQTFSVSLKILNHEDNSHRG